MSNVKYYIKRRADQDLTENLMRGDNCLTISPPKTGKTSLLRKVKSELEGSGFQCAAINVNTNSRGEDRRRRSEVELHWEIISELAEQFTHVSGESGRIITIKETDAYRSFRHHHININELWPTFIEEILLELIQENIIVFVDELEGFLNTQLFSDQCQEIFLDMILNCINSENCQKLTFSIFGSEAALQLNQNGRYNLLFTSRKHLKDFTYNDLETSLDSENITNNLNLTQRLSTRIQNWNDLINRVLYYTNGQPLLSHELLSLFFDTVSYATVSIRERTTRDRIEEIAVDEIYTRTPVKRHLESLVEKLHSDAHWQVLGEIRRNGNIVYNNENSTHRELIYIGLLIRTQENNILKIHNPIFEKYFYEHYSSSVSSPNPLPDLPPSSNQNSPPASSSNRETPTSRNFGELQRALQSGLQRIYSIFIDPNLSAIEKIFQILLAIWMLLPFFHQLSLLIYTKITSFVKNFRQKYLSSRSPKLSQIIPITTIVLALVIGLGSIRYYFPVHEANRLAISGLHEFESQEIEALETAIQAGNLLNNILKDELLRKLNPYFEKLSPLLVLRTITSQIHEYNRIPEESLKQNLPVISVAFNSKYNWIVTGEDDQIRLRDASGKVMISKANPQVVTSIILSNDKKYIAVGGNNGVVTIWQLQGLVFQNALTGCHPKTDRISSLSFSKDDKHLITGGSEAKVCVWKRNQENEDFKLMSWFKAVKRENVNKKNPERKNIYSVTIKKQLIAIATGDGNVQIRRLDRIQQPLIEWNPQPEVVPLSIDFNNAENKLVVGRKNGEIELWSWDDRNKRNKPQKARSWKINNSRQQNENPYVKVGFSEEDEPYAIFQGNDELTVNLSIPSKPISLKGYGINGDNKIEDSSYDPKTHQLVTVAQKNQIRLWCLEWCPQVAKSSPTLKTRFNTGQIHLDSLVVELNDKQPRSASLVTLNSNSGSVKLWSIGGNSVHTEDLMDLQPISKIDFKNDVIVVLGKKNGIINYVNLKGEILSSVIDTKQVDISSIAYNNASQGLIAIGNSKGEISLWNNKSEEVSSTKHETDGLISLIKFSPNKKFLIAVGSDNNNKVGLWDVTDIINPKLLKNMIKKLKEESYPGGIVSIDISTDNHLAIAAKNGSKIYFHDLSHGKELNSLDTKTQDITGIGFGNFVQDPSISQSPRTYLAMANSAGLIKIWDYPTHQEIAEFKSELKNITSFSFSPDGRYIVVGGDNGIVEVWSVESLKELLGRGCNWLRDYHSNHPESKASKICMDYTAKDSAAPTYESK